ncbi:imidazole glycerol phosphate synthase subunit HisH [Xenorhabdus sp. DI]|uniref:imidazole glycerol phosphate synthase subunit HisH n=1 Tax=Xenorhabdus doucetiae TaxID=351671 RepID=UPI001982E0DD|nr:MULTISPECIES: imidazole glycerol phosphate synthase subunit HisH [unclassified Xenorhabdus]MBD2785775.1 imidazole glycerol phosphate synthase subunit HisH [Xenorhabdus sp. 3]MBD2789164.1 imidazole glycerol phosphate synthase subunit HisH [Xenorhabdus sp. DI]
MIRIIDYGVGNIQAFMNMFKRLGVAANRAHSANDLQDATHLILPGVGAFDHAMEMFNKSGMRPALEELVLNKKVPILGICVGMQMLAESSDEGKLQGLNWIPGNVRSFSSNPKLASLPLPHMGWNDITIKLNEPLFKGFETSPRFYFLHSYYFTCENREHVAATAQYGFNFDCVISSENIYGIQCHPEKSHSSGAQLLKNFSEL